MRWPLPFPLFEYACAFFFSTFVCPFASVFVLTCALGSGAMKTLTLLALASGLYIQASHAAVQFSFAKQKIGGHEDVLGSTRRSDTIKPSLAYRDATYVVDVTVGTPGQPVSLQLSPSASNTFVIDRRSDWCTVSYYYSSYDDEDIDDSDTNESEYCPWGTCKSVSNRSRGIPADEGQ